MSGPSLCFSTMTEAVVPPSDSWDCSKSITKEADFPAKVLEECRVIASSLWVRFCTFSNVLNHSFSEETTKLYFIFADRDLCPTPDLKMHWLTLKSFCVVGR